MKLHVKANLAQLEKELRVNEMEIKRLETRNSKIKGLFESINQLLGYSPRAKSTHPLKDTIQKGSRSDKVMNILEHGEDMHVREIAERFFFSDSPTQAQVNDVANICGALLKTNKVKRPSRGVYRTRFPVHPIHRPEESLRTAISSADIGHDTHVKQITQSSQQAQH